MKRRSKIAAWDWITVMLAVSAFWLPFGAAASDGNDQAPGHILARQATRDQAHWTTSDHSRHAALQKEFSSGAAITEACLSCHSEAAQQFKQTIHWTWIGDTTQDGKVLGKAGDSLNNFCISTKRMTDKSCLDCHPGWNGKEADINCLNCHSGKRVNWTEAFEDYNAFSLSDDSEEKELAREIQQEIQAAARTIGRPTRQNCGECHFKGGGGDGVKHGDLDSSLAKPNRSLDVHMAEEGRNFECTRCHTTVRHQIAGRIYSKPASTERKSLIEDDLTAKITCESCHGAAPHAKGHKANDHTDKVACQSCHVPEFARVLPTKLTWDWSQGGKLKDGKPYKEKGPGGTIDYMSIKGAMTWGKNVQPEYAWFNGTMKTMTVKDRIDPSREVAVNEPLGAPEDPDSRIFPFKVHRGKQPYDKIHKNIVAPMLSGVDGYWSTLDWPRAIAKGMAVMEVPYSGEFDFVATRYVLPTTHMIAPKENVVSCVQCHVRQGGRMADIAGVYLPGRDRSGWLDALGWIAVFGGLIGVSLHGLGRIFTRGRKKA